MATKRDFTDWFLKAIKPAVTRTANVPEKERLKAAILANVGMLVQPVPDVGHYTHDSAASVLRDELPDRALSGPQGAGQRLVDDRYGFARCAIRPRKRPSCQQADPE